jgi:hypothetical protein
MLGLADLRVVWGQKYTECFVGITQCKSAIWNSENDMGEGNWVVRGGRWRMYVAVLHLRVLLAVLYW